MMINDFEYKLALLIEQHAQDSPFKLARRIVDEFEIKQLQCEHELDPFNLYRDPKFEEYIKEEIETNFRNEIGKRSKIVKTSTVDKCVGFATIMICNF